MSQTTMLGALSAFSASLTWAVGSSAYSKLSHQYSAAVINTTRALVALAAFLLAILLVDHPGTQSSLAALDTRHWAWLSISMLSSYAFGDLLFLWSTRLVGVSAALSIASIYPLWSALGGFLFRGESLSVHQGFGLVATVVGVFVVVRAGSGSASSLVSKRKKLGGFAIAGVTSLLWAVNTIAVTKGSEGLSALVAGGMRMAIALLLCPIVGLVCRQNLKPPFIVGADFRRYGWLFLVEGFGGTLFFVYGFSHASVAVAGTLSSLAPVLSVPIGYLVTREPVSMRQVGGILLVTLGVTLLLI